MKPIRLISALLFLFLFISGCNTQSDARQETDLRIPVIFDTDANNELDDQHALAYLLFNKGTFFTVGITVNATRFGGEIGEHVKEAERVVQLCGMDGKVPLLSGANGSYLEIREHLGDSDFDGHAAVNFIIEEALKKRESKLVLLPVGKLTNIALALEKEPSIVNRVRVVWLGANYPEPGEYNLENDIASMNYVLSTGVPFEMVTVRYGKPSGTAAVSISQDEVFEKMPGLGPESEKPVTGRHGGSFSNFGDYSVNLFSHIDFHDEGKHRSLFDMAAVAIVKDPSWATTTEIPCPVYLDGQWVEQAGNERKILVWEHFDKEKILADFFKSFN